MLNFIFKQKIKFIYYKNYYKLKTCNSITKIDKKFFNSIYKPRLIGFNYDNCLQQLFNLYSDIIDKYHYIDSLLEDYIIYGEISYLMYALKIFVDMTESYLLNTKNNTLNILFDLIIVLENFLYFSQYYFNDYDLFNHLFLTDKYESQEYIDRKYMKKIKINYDTNKSKQITVSVDTITGKQILSIKNPLKLFGNKNANSIYRKLVKRFHPDVNPSIDVKYFQHINNLYEEYKTTTGKK